MRNFLAAVGLVVVVRKGWDIYWSYTAMKRELKDKEANRR